MVLLTLSLELKDCIRKQRLPSVGNLDIYPFLLSICYFEFKERINKF
jgi:hypothetical protein